MPRVRPESDAPSSSRPDVEAPHAPQMDHSFVLQAVMQVQKDVGSLSAKLDHLDGDVRSIAGKLDKLRLAAAWAAGVFATIIGFAALVPPSVRERLFRAIVGE